MVAKTNRYIPSRGDIVLLNFDPTKGHEQKGHRPAFVISPLAYNKSSSLVLVMPITSHPKGYPFEVILPSGLKTHGVILVDQLRCLDWKVRGIKLVESAPQDLIEEVQAKIEPLVL